MMKNLSTVNSSLAALVNMRYTAGVRTMVVRNALALGAGRNNEQG